MTVLIALGKIGITLVQILGQLGSALKLEWPGMFVYFVGQCGILLGGGRDNVMRGNTFVRTDTAIHFDIDGRSMGGEKGSAGSTLASAPAGGAGPTAGGKGQTTGGDDAYIYDMI